MKIRFGLALLLFLCCINVAAAVEYSYWIEDTNAVWIPINVQGNSNTTMYVEKTAGYTPSIADTMIFGDEFNGDLSQWDTIKRGAAGTAVITDGALVLTPGSTNYDGIGINSKTGILANGYMIESRLYSGAVRYNQLGTGNITGFITSTTMPAGTNGYLAVIDTDRAGGLFKAGTSTGALVSLTDYPARNTWFTSRIRYDASGQNGYTLNSGSEITASDTTYLSTDKKVWIGNGFYSGYGGGLKCDWIFVRKYVENEPTATVTDMGTYYVIEIHNNEATALTGYQVAIGASELDISSSAESIKISDVPPYPEVEVTLTSPASGSYVADNTLGFTISGMGNFSAIAYVDSSAVWSGAVTTGLNQITPSLSQGSHSWYVVASSTVGEDTVQDTSDTWTFTYDTIYPSPSTVIISPDADNIAVGTTVNTRLRWSDTNLDSAEFYVNYGAGYILEDSITFTGSPQWFNTSIDTTGYVGQSITWKQVASDEAGNSYIYSDSFAVVLNALNIYVYDEKTGVQILPSNVVVYNEDISQDATISGVTKVASLTYTNLASGKYIVNVAAEGYYTRRAIMMVDVTSLSELNIYLPSTNETIIYDTFKLSDNTRIYEPTDIVIRLDKPMPTGTDTIFSSYFDFAGSAATYLIASDQYVLYIITPEATYNYGWLTPDPDGQIDININRFTFETVEEWIQYTYNESQSGVSFSYSSTEPISTAYMIVNKDGVEDYNATATTVSGQFTYLFSEDGIYTIEVRVISQDNLQFIRNSVVQVGAGKTINPFPAGYTLALKSVVVAFIIVVGMLASSSYRADLACMYGAAVYAFAVYQDWCIGNAYTVSIVGIIAVAAIVKFQRKHERSV